MEITVNVDHVDLKDVVGHNADDTERTLGDKVAEDIVTRIAAGPYWAGITTRVEKIRDELIRTAIAPIIAEAMQCPTIVTNFMGLPTGQKRTMRELVLEQAREFLNSPADGTDRRNGSVLEHYIRREIATAVRAEIVTTVHEIRDRVLAEVGQNIPDMVAAAVGSALKAQVQG